MHGQGTKQTFFFFLTISTYCFLLGISQFIFILFQFEYIYISMFNFSNEFDSICYNQQHPFRSLQFRLAFFEPFIFHLCVVVFSFYFYKYFPLNLIYVKEF